MKCTHKDLDCPYVDPLSMSNEPDCERCENYPGNEEEVEEEKELTEEEALQNWNTFMMGL